MVVCAVTGRFTRIWADTLGHAREAQRISSTCCQSGAYSFDRAEAGALGGVPRMSATGHRSDTISGSEYPLVSVR